MIIKEFNYLLQADQKIAQTKQSVITKINAMSVDTEVGVIAHVFIPSTIGLPEYYLVASDNVVAEKNLTDNVIKVTQDAFNADDLFKDPQIKTLLEEKIVEILSGDGTLKDVVNTIIDDNQHIKDLLADVEQLKTDNTDNKANIAENQREIADLKAKDAEIEENVSELQDAVKKLQDTSDWEIL
jgi:hypothetical protein